MSLAWRFTGYELAILSDGRFGASRKARIEAFNGL